MADTDPNIDAVTEPLWNDAPVTRVYAIALCILLIVFFFAQLFFLFGFWPVEDSATQDWSRSFSWFVWPELKLKIEHSQRLVIVVLICGGIGAQVRTIASFALHMAHRDLSRYWTYWFILYPFQGAVVAFVVYFVCAAGLAGDVTKAVGTGGNTITISTKIVDLFRAGAIAGLVGMFSEQAVEKLREIANTVLAKPVSKVPTLAPSSPQLSGDPPAVAVAANQSVALKGRGLDKVTKVEIGSQAAAPDPATRTPLALMVTIDGAALGAGDHAIKFDGKDTGKKLKVA